MPYQETFDAAAITTSPLLRDEYEECTFRGCDLSGKDLSGFRFIDCTFEHCNLSNAHLAKTVLSNATFSECKLLGLHFADCSPFGITLSFTACKLEHASFYNLKIPGTTFHGCDLHEADLSGADLSSTVFSDCDLTGAIFDGTNIEKADLRTAHNYIIDPENNRIKRAKFSVPAVAGLLSKYNIEIDLH